MSRRVAPSGAAALVACVALLSARPTGLASPASGPASLTSLVTGPQSAARDTNGDGLRDAVVARVIVAARPSADDLEAAANIAARIAYESTAMDAPLVIRDDEVREPASIGLPILVGRENRFVKELASKGTIDLKGLGPGQGLVAAVGSPLGGPPGLVVAGGDEAGTLAAGVELAARLPRLWSMTGATLGAVEQQAAAFLQRRGVASRTVTARSLVVDAERRGIASVLIEVELASDASARALSALAALDQAHRRGGEPGTMSYAEVAKTVVRVTSGGQLRGSAEVGRSGLNGRTLTPPVEPDEFLPEPQMGERGAPPPPRTAPAKPYDLTNALSIDGWLGDAYVDLIPDRTDTVVITDSATDSRAGAEIAARLGLESTGISLPITKRDAKVKEPPMEPSPILVGRANALVGQLVKIGKARIDGLEAGDGVVQVVPRAFGSATATVVAGADGAGTDAAGAYVGRRLPYLWEARRGAPTYDDLVEEASRFLNGRSAAGQAAQAATEITSILDEAKEKTLQSVEATVFLEKADPALAEHLASSIRASRPGVEVTVKTQAATEAVPVFEEKIDLAWEVDEFRARVKSDLLPTVKAGSKVEVEARLSESLEIRRKLAAEVRDQLVKAGASAPRVTVASAYKQGFHWITEQVIPELKGKGARSIRLTVKSAPPDLSKAFKFYSVPSRWLHELYPVDEIVARELGIPVGSFGKELAEGAKDVYALEALDGNGRLVHRATFNPKVVEREYLEKFPGWSRVEVTTGWFSASVDGRPVVDARIQTDPERFWDHYQTRILPKVYDHVMKVTGGKPTSDKQPFFRDLDVEVWMSEPDYRLGIDEELVSALEALHEDIYFVTLDYFGAMGRTLTRSRLGAPGKILPIIHPERPGQAGQARVLYAGNASAKPKIQLRYTEKGSGKPTEVTREFTRIDTTPPVALRAVVRADRVKEIELQAEAKDDKEAGRAADVIDALTRLQAAGLFRQDLSFDHVERVTFAIGLREARSVRSVRNTGRSAPSKIRASASRAASPIVTWDHVIGPDEAEAIVAKLAAFPEVKAYKIGESYRGRDLSVLELTLPSAGELVSTAKLTAYKPTIFIMGRQHANEVSSTSHILRLGELIVTDPAYRKLLEKLNVVLVPVQNPDGTAIAYELQKLTPTHMLHAGRYSALGMDVSNRTGGLLPEAEVEGRVWREWLPDIYLNPHGYPSHEWVQQFAGYVPPGFRAYLTSRGWYTMLSSLRDPRYPEHLEATNALREAIASQINASAEVRAMNLRNQARYERWAFGYAPHLYGVEVYKDVMIYYTDPESGEVRGSRRAAAAGPGGGRGRANMSAYPQVTFNSGMTEAPDETAQGSWLQLVTRAGFNFLMAHVEYLRDGRFTVERIEENSGRDGSTITTLRVRPVMPRQR